MATFSGDNRCKPSPVLPGELYDDLVAFEAAEYEAWVAAHEADAESDLVSTLKDACEGRC